MVFAVSWWLCFCFSDLECCEDIKVEVYFGWDPFILLLVYARMVAWCWCNHAGCSVSVCFNSIAIFCYVAFELLLTVGWCEVCAIMWAGGSKNETVTHQRHDSDRIVKPDWERLIDSAFNASDCLTLSLRCHVIRKEVASLLLLTRTWLLASSRWVRSRRCRSSEFLMWVGAVLGHFSATTDEKK